MKHEIKRIIGRKRHKATVLYEKKMDELFKAYHTASNFKDKNQIIKQISLVSRAYNYLQNKYDDAAESILQWLERDIDGYEDYFDAKIKGLPHDWD